jgi:uncharacterized membrane protein
LGAAGVRAVQAGKRGRGRSLCCGLALSTRRLRRQASAQPAPQLARAASRPPVAPQRPARRAVADEARHHAMTEKLVSWLQALPPSLVVAFLSAAPVSELRGGIPVGICYYHLHWLQAWFIGLLANVVVVVPLLLIFMAATNYLCDKPLVGRPVAWLVHHARRREGWVKKYGPWALTVIATIPLPGFGAWSAALLAAVLGVPFFTSLACIALGTFFASGLVTALTLGGVLTYNAWR